MPEYLTGSSRAEPADLLQSLPRVLGLSDLIFLIIGTVIGSGIFLVPGTVLRPLGNSIPWAISVWVTGGIVSLLGALTYGELSAMKPQAGGLYIFIRDCFGPLPAFLFGWTLFFVISAGSVATLSVAFTNYLGAFLTLKPICARVVSLAVILLVALVNVRGTRQSANFQNVTTITKIFAIFFMSILLLYLGKGFSARTAPPIHLGATGIASGFGIAMIGVLWAYEGWQYATFSAGETVNPQRNFPLAFLLSLAVLIMLYVLANLGYIAALGANGVSQSTNVASSAMGLLVGPVAAKLVAATILVSMYSAANSIVLTCPRVFYAMARDGVFFERFAHVHSRFKTPAFAISLCCAWAAVLAVTGTFQQLLTYVVFIGWIFYALAAAAVIVYRRREPDAPRAYRVPGYPFTPIIFILAAVALVLNTLFTQTRQATLGLGIVTLGVPAYLFWQRKTSRAVRS
jgi:basic amino acid/polyamine antiporter, APA family